MASFEAVLEAVDLDGWMEENADGTKTLTLEYGGEIKVGTGKELMLENVASLTLRRPKGREMDTLERGMGGKFMEAARNFAQSLVIEPKTLPSRFAGDLDAADMMRLIAVALTFLPRPSASRDGGTPPGL